MRTRNADSAYTPCLGRLHAPPQTAALMHFCTAAPQSPHWLQWGTPKITPSHRPIPKPNYQPYPWTRLPYCPKPHPYQFSHFATMHWTDRQTQTQTNKWLVGMVCNYRPLSLDRERHSLIIDKTLM